MTTLPAASASEVRLTLRYPDGDTTDAPAQGWAWLYPNLKLGTRYRASNVDEQVAVRTRLVFDASGNLETAAGAWASVLASDAAGHTHPGLQWVLELHLDGVPPQEQPAKIYFTPNYSFTNVGLLADTTPQPAVQTVYVSSAPIISALNTTDSGVANLFTTATTTRTTTDARYVLQSSQSVANFAALPTTGNWLGRLMMTADTGAVYKVTSLPSTWKRMGLLGEVAPYAEAGIPAATLAANTWTALPLSTPTLSGVTWSSGTNTRLVMPIIGRWRATANGVAAATADGRLRFSVNGSSLYGEAGGPVGAGGLARPGISAEFTTTAATDYVQVFGLSDSGGGFVGGRVTLTYISPAT